MRTLQCLMMIPWLTWANAEMLESFTVCVRFKITHFRYNFLTLDNRGVSSYLYQSFAEFYVLFSPILNHQKICICFPFTWIRMKTKNCSRSETIIFNGFTTTNFLERVTCTFVRKTMKPIMKTMLDKTVSHFSWFGLTVRSQSGVIQWPFEWLLSNNKRRIPLRDLRRRLGPKFWWFEMIFYVPSFY